MNCNGFLLSYTQIEQKFNNRFYFEYLFLQIVWGLISLAHSLMTYLSFFISSFLNSSILFNSSIFSLSNSVISFFSLERPYKQPIFKSLNTSSCILLAIDLKSFTIVATLWRVDVKGHYLLLQSIELRTLSLSPLGLTNIWPLKKLTLWLEFVKIFMFEEYWAYRWYLLMDVWTVLSLDGIYWWMYWLFWV